MMAFIRYPVLLLAVMIGLGMGATLRAGNFTADIGGMRIEVAPPWYLYAHGYSENVPDRLFLALVKRFGDGAADIVGEAFVREYQAGADATPASRDELRRMNPEALRAYAEELTGKYAESRIPVTDPVLADINGFTAITYRRKKDGTENVPEPSYDFGYYYLLGDRLVCLHAYVYGSEDDAAVLGKICDSFVPETESGRRVTEYVLRDGIMVLRVPREWDVMMKGKGQRLRAQATKYSAETDKLVAQVSILAPDAADDSFVAPPPAWHPDTYFEDDGKLTFYALGTRAPLRNMTDLRTGPVTINGMSATLTTAAGNVKGRGDVTVEVRDLVRDGEKISIVTGYPVPLPEDVRTQLEALYASFASGGQ